MATVVANSVGRKFTLGVAGIAETCIVVDLQILTRQAEKKFRGLKFAPNLNLTNELIN